MPFTFLKNLLVLVLCFVVVTRPTAQTTAATTCQRKTDSSNHHMSAKSGTPEKQTCHVSEALAKSLHMYVYIYSHNDVVSLSNPAS